MMKKKKKKKRNLWFINYSMNDGLMIKEFFKGETAKYIKSIKKK